MVAELIAKGGTALDAHLVFLVDHGRPRVLEHDRQPFADRSAAGAGLPAAPGQVEQPGRLSHWDGRSDQHLVEQVPVRADEFLVVNVPVCCRQGQPGGETTDA